MYHLPSLGFFLGTFSPRAFRDFLYEFLAGTPSLSILPLDPDDSILPPTPAYHGQERKCAFSHFLTRAHQRIDQPTNRPTDGQLCNQTSGETDNKTEMLMLDMPG